MSKIRKNTDNRARYRFFLGFLILFMLIIYIALFVDDTFIRPYFGDVLVVIAIYFLLCSLLKSVPKLLSLYVFLFAFTIELLQYVNILELLGLSNSGYISILTGATFDFADILCYASGCIFTAIFQIVINRKRKDAADSNKSKL